jgi:hypothetical protein
LYGVNDINKIIRDVCNCLNVNLADITRVFKKYDSKDLYAEIDQKIKIYFYPSKKGIEL